MHHMSVFKVNNYLSLSLIQTLVAWQLNLRLSCIQDIVMLNGFGTVVNALGKRVKPYLPQICGTILWRLNNKSAKVRQQAADLISRIAQVMMTCGEVKLAN